MNIRTAIMILAGVSSSALAGDMQALSEDALSSISGQEGIAMNLEIAINSTVSGNTVTPTACPANTADCRLAFQLNDRTNQWIVLKDYYGLIRLNKVWLDAATSDASASAYVYSSASDPVLVAVPNRFPSGINFYSQPMVQLSYDHSSLGASTSFYGDAAIYLNASRMTMEFGTTGYLNNAVTGSALALKMADGPNAVNGAAQIRFDGKMQMSGFGF